MVLKLNGRGLFAYQRVLESRFLFRVLTTEIVAGFQEDMRFCSSAPETLLGQWHTEEST